MLKENLKNYVAIGVLSVAFLTISLNFTTICDTIAKIFKL